MVDASPSLRLQASAAQAAAPTPAPASAPAVPVAPQPESHPPAGWYVDPVDAQQRRWWNGTEWTAHVRTVLPTPPVVVRPSVIPLAAYAAGASQDARGSIRDLAADISAPRVPSWTARPGSAASAQLRATGATARQPVAWYEKPERNPLATAGFVFGILAIVANPAALMTVLALLFGAIGLAKSSGTFRAVGRRLAGWAIALGIVGGIVWGAASWWAFAHPEFLASVGIRL